MRLETQLERAAVDPHAGRRDAQARRRTRSAGGSAA
jgi:hypothetical protein